MDKPVNITNFIGVYDNYIPPQECNKAITLYKNQDKFNNTMNRIGSEKSSILKKQDQQFFANENNMDVRWEELKPRMVNLDLEWNN